MLQRPTRGRRTTAGRFGLSRRCKRKRRGSPRRFAPDLLSRSAAGHHRRLQKGRIGRQHPAYANPEILRGQIPEREEGPRACRRVLTEDDAALRRTEIQEAPVEVDLEIAGDVVSEARLNVPGEAPGPRI